MSGTKAGELHRTAEHVVNIAENQGMFFAIAFLVDSQYTRAELGQIADIMHSRRLGFRRIEP